MSKTSARIALVLALVGLAAAGENRLRACMFADPTTAQSATSRPSVGHAGLRRRFGTFKGISVSIFGGIWFAFAALLSVAGMTARPTVREVFRDICSQRPPWRSQRFSIGLCVVCHPEARVRVVPHHLCRRDWALPRLWRGHLIPR